ncbi:hypothetical protein F511_43984 [Dorcoceras hygrometricum]|uniref:Dystroglycan-like n=1 Tax=Dorcoceras hygrometricum TaxID=472368 RepID=A0A2Z7C4B1_9LAMI|nr:hypothetical protein F511_43984 [Dorcoceras hygrometricum]
MASSFYSNTQHIDFDSVLAMDDPGMVSMFQALKASGLEGFLGCPAVIYEASLVDFFENALVRDGVIISTVAGQLVEISEVVCSSLSDLPVDGLADLSEIPKDVVFDARSIVSMSGSFNAITVEKLTAVVCGVRMNWASVLFNILKKMVTLGSKQTKGFAVQISLLLENIPNLELGESSEFPASKILTEKTVHRYVSLNDKVGAEEAAGAPKPNATSKKRPAAVLGDEPVVKKKRTMKNKSSSSKDIFAQPDAEDEIPADPPADEVTSETVDEEAADEGAYEETADDVIIEQVLDDTAQIRVDEEDQVLRTSGEGNQPAGTAEERQWFDLPYDDLIARWDAERIVTTPSDTDEEIETERAVGTADGDRVLGALRRDSNDQRNLMSMDIKSSHKHLSTQIVSNALDVVDVRRVVRENHQELTAKVTSLEEQVAATRHDLLDFSAQAQQTLNVITDQLSKLVAYINRGGNEKKGEVNSSRTPPDNQNRGSGNTGGGGDIVRTTDITQRYIDTPQRNILERLMNANRERERSSKSRSGSGSYKRRR